MKFGYYLLIKEAADLNMKYLCKCADYKDPLTYKGSGTYWRRILKKHQPILTTTILGHYNTNAELRMAGIYYSKKFNIVEDKTWANLIEEIGDGGPTTKNKIRAYNTFNPKEQKFFKSENEIPENWKRGRPSYPRSAESIEKTAKFHKGRKRSETTRENMRNSTRRKRKTIPCKFCNSLITPQNIVSHQSSCQNNNGLHPTMKRRNVAKLTSSDHQPS